MAKKAQPGGNSSRGFYKAIKAGRHSYEATHLGSPSALTDKDRVEALSEAISIYIVKNLPEAIERREGLKIRTNPQRSVDLRERDATRRVGPIRQFSIPDNKLTWG